MERRSSLKVAPTLIIGFGGTGALALQYAKRKIRARLQKYSYGRTHLPAKIPFIEYLVIDTTPLEEQLEPLLGDEFFNMGHINVSRIADKFRSDPHGEYEVLDWFPFDDLDPGQIDAGAQGVRHIGRLCFFLRKGEIESSIKSKIDSITNTSEVNRALTNDFFNISVETDSTINVHIVTSMCGGTGSGCLLDATYLIKQVINEKLQQNVGPTAHLVTVEPFESEQGIARTIVDYIHYNFAMTLSELEHFTSSRLGWDVKYLDQTRVRSKDKPFSFVYLLGNRRRDSLNKRQVCEMIGETITLKTVFSEANDLKGKLDNMKAYVLNSEDVSRKRNSYSSYNMRLLSVRPDDALIEAALYEAQLAVLSTLTFKGSNEDVDQAYNEFESSVFFKRTEIKHITAAAFREFVQKKIDVNPEEFTVAKKQMARAEKRWTQSGKRKSRLAASTQIDAVYSQQKASAETGLQPIKSHLLKGLDSIKQALDIRINELLKEGSSVGHVQQLLDQISIRFKEAGDSLSDFENECVNEAIIQKNLMDSAVGLGSAIEFTQAAAKRVTADLRHPMLSRLAVKLNELREYIRQRSEWCSGAQNCLRNLKSSLQSKLIRDNSYTRHSIWTRDSIVAEVDNNKVKFVQRFIEALEEKYDSSERKLDKSVCFLPHLASNQACAQDFSSILRTAVSETLTAIIGLDSFPFNSTELDSKFPVLWPSNIHQFVEMASPLWQLEIGGDKVTNIGLTNWHEDSETGQVLRNKSKDIRFTANGNGFEEVFLFRSEHGVSINRLSNMERCIGAVRRRLALKGKSRINELCLDKSWNIQDPLPIESIEYLLLLFTLATLLGIIDHNNEEYFFFDFAKKKVVLSRPEGEEFSARRHSAFVQFRRFTYEGDTKVGSLIAKIKETLTSATTIERTEYENRRDMTNEQVFHTHTLNIRAFHEEVARHRDVLRKDSEIQKEEEKQQYEAEITALTALIDDISRMIEEERNKYLYVTS